MAQTIANEVDHTARPVIDLAVRVWRMVAGAPLGLFTYAGEADAAVLHAVLQIVGRLTAAVPGDWRVDVVSSGFDADTLRAIESGFGDLRRGGVRPRLALAPRLRPEITALLHAPLPAFGPRPGELYH